MPGITFGVGASAFLVFWALVVFALDEMIDRAFRKSYGNPMEAIQGMIEIGIEFFQYVTPLQVASTLIGGGAVIGVIAYLVSRRWS